MEMIGYIVCALAAAVHFFVAGYLCHGYVEKWRARKLGALLLARIERENEDERARFEEARRRREEAEWPEVIGQ